MTETVKMPLGGRFLTFEGIDGCGKTSQARLLAQLLRERGHPVVETREPGGTPIGRGLRGLLLAPEHGRMAPSCELLLYLADRIQHLTEVVRPALGRGDTVICDRHHDATVAYQHFGRGLDFAPVERLIESEIATTPPDLTFWLDVSLETAGMRMANREAEQGGQGAGSESRMDREERAFHQRVREGYGVLWREAPERIVRIEGEAGIEAIAPEIRRRLEERYVL